MNEEHYKNKAEYLDKRELELLAEIAKLEKDLHMVQRHYDQLNLPDGYVVVCVHCAKELKIEFDESTDPFIWMDDCGTWFTNEAYQALDADLKDGLFPLYTSPQSTALTDDEILQIYADIDGAGILNFARAIESRLSAKIAKYEQVLQSIANDYHELSDHKIEVQVRNHKKWAREALE